MRRWTQIWRKSGRWIRKPWDSEIESVADRVRDLVF